MAERKIFTQSIVPLPDTPGLHPNGLMISPATDDHRTDEMTVHFSLDIAAAAQAELEDRVARGDIVSPAELQDKYAVQKADVDKLSSWLKSEGFDVEEVSSDGTSVYARAPVGQIEKSLDVDMVRVTRDGLTYTAARTPPSLPSDIGDSVGNIGGLQPFLHAHKHSKKRTPHRGNRSRIEKTAGGKATLSPNVMNSPPYLVSEILAAYNGSGLSVTGKGQTIAILIDTFPTNSDVRSFWQQNGIPGTISRVKKINVKGGALPSPEGEETLDVEWSSGIAPGATIRVYASGSLQFTDLDRALDRIIADLSTQPGLHQLSISLGLGENFLGGPNGEVATQHKKFLRLTAAGVNVFVSSGDAGSNPDDTGHSADGPLQAEYEASDSTVIGVGGTSLTLSPTGAVAAEKGWVGSGGGTSQFFARPIWQVAAGVPAGTQRLVPDVSLVADPETGGLVVLHGSVQQFGGTSWSAPVWAGIAALINESRAKSGKAPLSFLNPHVYPLLKTCFRDVTAGTNGAFTAGPGYDQVTGLGVPNVKALIQALG